MRLYSLPVAVALLAFAYAGPAPACGALPCAQVNDVQPEDGSVGLPLNTEIRISYFGSLESSAETTGCEIDLTRIRLLPSNGAAIELQGALLERPSAAEAWAVAKPAEPLSAGTAYEVQLELGGGVEVCGCDARQWRTKATFTTGSDSDRAAPLFSGLSALNYGALTESSNDCGDSKLIPALPVLDAASDAFPGTRYNVYVDGAIEKRYVESLTGPASASEVYVDCGSTALSTGVRLEPGSEVEVRAVDSAGNESGANDPIRVSAVCEAVAAEPVRDVDTDDTVSSSTAASPISAPEPPSVRQSSGCVLIPGIRGSSGMAFWAVLLVCLRRRSAPKTSARK